MVVIGCIDISDECCRRLLETFTHQHPKIVTNFKSPDHDVNILVAVNGQNDINNIII